MKVLEKLKSCKFSDKRCRRVGISLSIIGLLSIYLFTFSPIEFMNLEFCKMDGLFSSSCLNFFLLDVLPVLLLIVGLIYGFIIPILYENWLLNIAGWGFKLSVWMFLLGVVASFIGCSVAPDAFCFVISFPFIFVGALTAVISLPGFVFGLLLHEFIAKEPRDYSLSTDKTIRKLL